MRLAASDEDAFVVGQLLTRGRLLPWKVGSNIGNLEEPKGRERGWGEGGQKVQALLMFEVPGPPLLLLEMLYVLPCCCLSLRLFFGGSRRC